MNSPASAGVDRLDVHVVVSGDGTDAEDDGVPGTYGLNVQLARAIDLAMLTADQTAEIADSVLGVFHERRPIACLADFDIQVRLANGQELDELDGHLGNEPLVVSVTYRGLIATPWPTHRTSERRG